MGVVGEMTNSLLRENKSVIVDLVRQGRGGGEINTEVTEKNEVAGRVWKEGKGSE